MGRELRNRKYLNGVVGILSPVVAEPETGDPGRSRTVEERPLGQLTVCRGRGGERLAGLGWRPTLDAGQVLGRGDHGRLYHAGHHVGHGAQRNAVSDERVEQLGDDVPGLGGNAVLAEVLTLLLSLEGGRRGLFIRQRTLRLEIEQPDTHIG